MSSGKSSSLSNGVCLVVAVSFLSWPHLVEATNYKIKIGPRPKDLTDQQSGQPVQQSSVSKAAKDTIHWDTHKQGRVIFLIFHVSPDCGTPFDLLTDLHAVDTNGRKLFQLGNVATEHLDSGTISEACRCVCTQDPAQCNAIDPANPKPWQIKYDQYLRNGQGQIEHADGWIIVKP